jgi:protein-L-isoaspartate(D-aspartate) O-methyltransferase
LTGTERVLEIGTGSGYQAAILSHLASRVYSVERIKVLADRARGLLDRLKLFNVVIKVFDGTFGWPEEAPFDAIIVTAGAPAVPQPLVDQLKEGGRLVVPVGDREEQRLIRVVKRHGTVQSSMLTECAFVPLIGTHAWAPDGAASSVAMFDGGLA